MKSRIKYWINPRHWSRLSGNDIDLLDLKQHIFFSQLCVVGCLFTIIQVVDDFYTLNWTLIPIDIVAIAIWPFGWWLNERGRHLLAKCIMIAFMNTLFFVMCGLLSPSIRFDMMYFPLIMLTFIVLGNKERLVAIGFSLASIAFLTILAVTDQRPFGDIIIMAPNKYQEVLNIVTVAVFMGASAVFILDLHGRAGKILHQQKDELTKANEELDRFVYSASHDMRSPLISIQGLVNVATLEGEMSPSSKEYFELIRNRAQKLDDLIKDITNYSRNSRLGVEIKEVNLQEIVEEAIEKIRFLENTKSIVVNRSVIGQPKVATDGGRLSILINNLLTNAIKYHDLTKPSPFVDVIFENSETELGLTIRDNGRGIEVKHHDKIFNMFYRASKNSEGSGLGLYIVKEMVEKLNGTIEWKSTYGQGTEFKIRIPHSPE